MEDFEKTWEQIHEFIDDVIAGQVEFYSERYPYTYDEAIRQDVPDAILKDKKFKELLTQYITEVYGQF